MKARLVGYESDTNGLSLEVIGETPTETALLVAFWKHGRLERGNGNSVTQDGQATGFYVTAFDRAKADEVDN